MENWAAVQTVRNWPIAPVHRRRVNDRTRGIAAIGSAKLNGSNGSVLRRIGNQAVHAQAVFDPYQLCGPTSGASRCRRWRFEGNSRLAVGRIYSTFSQRAAASAVSWGRVLNAIEALGADLCTALIRTSNSSKLFGGIRIPPPITTQSYVADAS